MLYDNEVRLHKAQISHYISNIKYILLQKKKNKWTQFVGYTGCKLQLS